MGSYFIFWYEIGGGASLLARSHRCHQLSSTQFLLNDNVLQHHKLVKYLGIIVDEGLSWSEQIGYVRRRSLSALAAIRRVSLYLSSNILVTLYMQCFCFTLPHLLLWGLTFRFCFKSISKNLQRIQNYAMRIIFWKPPRTSSQYCLRLLNWITLSQQQYVFVAYQIHKCVLKVAPAYLLSTFSSNSLFSYSSTRGRDKLYLFCPQTDLVGTLTVQGCSIV